MYANAVAVDTQPIHSVHYGEIHVTDTLLEDLLYLYAEDALEPDAADAFVARAAEDAAFRAVVRQIFCRACLGVNAALGMGDEAMFRAYVEPLELPELACDDPVLRRLLGYTLRKLGADADDAAEDANRFEQRMAYLLDLVQH